MYPLTYSSISVNGKNDNKWLVLFINLIQLCRQCAVNLIPVFDGKAPCEKDEERSERQEQRDKGDVKVFQIKIDLGRYKASKGSIKTPLLMQTMKELTIKNTNEKLKFQQKRLLPASNQIPSSSSNSRLSKPIGDDIEINVDMVEEYLIKREKNIFSIEPEDIALLKELFDKFKIPYIQAEDEAEACCNDLVKRGLADATFSLDSDCVAYQVPVLINDLNVNTGMCTVIYFSKLCELFELKPDEVTLFCCLCKTDYNRHTAIKGIGPVTALKLVKQWRTYEEIKKQDKRFQVADDGYRYKRNIELFSLTYPKITSVPIWDLRIDTEEITDWLKDHKLYYDPAKLKSLWKPPTIMFAEEEEESDE